MIKFVNDIDKDKLRMAYNNDILRFYSDSTVTASYADVVLKESGLFATLNPPKLFSVRLYPNPQGQFYINLQPYVAAVINTHNFEDTLQTELESASPDSFLYGYTSGTYLNGSLSITITHTDTTTTASNYGLAWLAAAQQWGNYNRIAKTDLLLLTPPKKDSLNDSYSKYWQGYPFDVSFMVPSGIFRSGIALKNETNGLSYTFPFSAGTINRLVFSDGRTDETLETVLPLTEGQNKISITNSSKQKWLWLEKIPYRCGVYLKWLNTWGGYSYWLFEDTYAIDRAVKYIGEIDSINANLENSFGRTRQIGKESQDTFKIVAELLTEEERSIVEGILDSPKIYLFTGQPFAKSSYRDWIEVTLKTSGARIKNPKQPLTNFSFDIELPMRFTQML
jgi:hypothetical protein